jgi:hypothetical protein
LAAWNALQPGSLAFPSVNIDQKPMPTTASHKIAFGYLRQTPSADSKVNQLPRNFAPHTSSATPSRMR